MTTKHHKKLYKDKSEVYFERRRSGKQNKQVEIILTENSFIKMRKKMWTEKE